MFARMSFGRDFLQVPFFGEFIQKNEQHALEVALFAAQKQREHRQGQKQKPEPGDFGADEAEDEEFKSAQRPKDNFGLE